jgi:hypothetical protein
MRKNIKEENEEDCPCGIQFGGKVEVSFDSDKAGNIILHTIDFCQCGNWRKATLRDRGDGPVIKYGDWHPQAESPYGC